MAPSPLEPLITFRAAPFHIGLGDGPNNPDPFPNLLPLRLGLDPETGLIQQMSNAEVGRLLSLAYERGSLLGTAMDESGPGKRYADDFMTFIAGVSDIQGQSILEIGAGRGYLLKRLRDAGAHVQGIEPGHANAQFWPRYDVPVVEAFFPTPLVSMSFDVIAAFSVMEHLEEPRAFLDAIRRQLRPGGMAILAVPDCAVHIADGDPSMVIHEHWSYFTPGSLNTTLALAGFSIRKLERSNYGGSIYVAAVAHSVSQTVDAPDEIEIARRFPEKCRRLRRNIGKRLQKLKAKRRSLGVYVPGRALMLLPPNADVRFFDDDREIGGRHYPPFRSQVETRAMLIERPVDELWVLSRSFGAKIAEALKAYPSLKAMRIVGMDKLSGGASAP